MNQYNQDATETLVYPPHSMNLGSVYANAAQELLTPYPSIEINEWCFFNKMVGGFRSREYSILCGPTGSGKTALLAAWSAQLLKQGVRHFVCSVENGPTDFMKRVMSILHGRDLNTGDPLPVDYLASVATKQLELVTKDIDCIQFSLYEDRFSVEQLMSDIRYMVKEKGVKIVFVDNLNFFMKPTRSSDMILEMDRVTHELIILCKSIDVHIVMVMHPKKTDGGRIESEFDIKGSSTAVQEAHNVFLFNRIDKDTLELYSGLNQYCRELKIAKLRRRGMYAGHRIYLEFKEGSYREAYAS